MFFFVFVCVDVVANSNRSKNGTDDDVRFCIDVLPMLGRFGFYLGSQIHQQKRSNKRSKKRTSKKRGPRGSRRPSRVDEGGELWAFLGDLERRFGSL